MILISKLFPHGIHIGEAQKDMTAIEKEYRIVPLHKRPDLIPDCCTLLNSEWPRSETARLKFLNVSCDEFPTCLILIDKEDRVLGHCKISLIPRLRHSCFIQSVIIDYQRRSQGLGSRLLRGAEEHVAKKGIKNVYLITKGQELFYLKNGYKTCDPFKASGINDVVYSSAAFTKAKLKEKSTQYCGPPPPPMPNFQMPKFYDLGILTHRTHMVKRLSSQ
ncbi:N-alpha-acetyltransferase 80 isoform X2 [Bombus vosnesenskii]|uniref:N-alpha-acetyltransferase 80 isoform X2 n=6 Tax=Pyrobombus TaxID=144703 RepID=A0A6J3JW63_9HYME|nr:N-alpha-acetyltransferase 80 isoform X2 [Bombus impatiens]XP_033191746.1 N-alpha-acetyltransferase 80 isoform X2 [Bombus vancouverensis nearcticus]XP_033299077.1 N-alpha-acetyltransferase 80 isoform X2 [Bombus bifarius]XP_033345077.1 N-alpha-acetyltransferase 80 isoform X2 [Bombus vosnesenskii]XP_043582704.1 N-alpha-acetyltransferase 80 isoform X2 [Bombus pyrosoma]XP_050486600.1 N-alpha-acetyltransferase 80 isoform X2 [Bombus huntii]